MNACSFFKPPWRISNSSFDEVCKKKVHRAARDQIVGGKTYKVEKMIVRMAVWFSGNWACYCLLKSLHISPVWWWLVRYLFINTMHNMDIWVRVANVVAHHDELLTQWRYTWMSKLGTNIFLISTTSNYLRSSAVCKNQHF